MIEYRHTVYIIKLYDDSIFYLIINHVTLPNLIKIHIKNYVEIPCPPHKTHVA